MNARRPAGHEPGQTRTRVLEAASEVFSEKGFRGATVAEICRRAGANIAAVNYYFRDKETLYVEAWRLAFERSLDAHPPDGGVPATAPLSERLRGQIMSLVQRVTDPGNHEFDIVHRELADPTGLLKEVMRESLEPLRQGLCRLVRELLGDGSSDERVQLCEMSILAQCLNPMIMSRHHGPCPDPARPGPPMLEIDTGAIVAHITRFCLAGIAAVRRQVHKGGGR